MVTYSTYLLTYLLYKGVLREKTIYIKEFFLILYKVRVTIHMEREKKPHRKNSK